MVIETSLFASALIEVIKVLAQKAIVEPALKKGLESFQARLTRDYDQVKAHEEWVNAMMAALDEMREKEAEKYPMIRATLNLTGLEEDAQHMLVATAISMARPDALKIPPTLLTSLQLDESDREWLSVYMTYLRGQLATREFYQPLIAYADKIDQRGLLEELSQELEQVAENTRSIANYDKIIKAQRRLTDQDGEALNKYLKLGRKEWGRLMLPMIRHRADDGRSYRLKEIFVPLLLQDKRAEEQARKKMETILRSPDNKVRENEEKTRPIDLTELIMRYNAFILIGRPGSGKTTLLRRAALAFAEGRAEKDLGWKGKPLFPIYIRLRNFSEFLDSDIGKPFCDPAPGAILEYLKNRYQNGEYMDLTPDFFSRRLEEGDCLILMDGLDETAHGRDIVAQHINALIQRFKDKNHFVISSRPGGYGKDEETALRAAQLARAEVTPLNARGIRQLIENLLSVMAWEDDQDRKTALQDLPTSILASSDLTSIASIPLFCSALVQVYRYNKSKLPERRVDVLDEIVTLLLGHWHASKGDVTSAKELGLEDGTQKQYKNIDESVEYKYRRLRHLAYYMHTVAKQYELDSETAVNVLSEYFMQKERIKDSELAESYAKGFLTNTHERSGLMAEITAATEHQPATYAFIHQNFAEFLAATELINRSGAVNTILEHIEDPWWEQVILYAGARRGEFDSLRSEIILKLINNADQKLRGRPKWIRRLSMAGHLARDMGGHLDGSVREELEKLLHEAATDIKLKPATRADIADVLDELWTPADLPTFVPIPNTQPPNFLLARYPVTNGQYERFISADDFQDKQYWTGFLKFAEPEHHFAPIGDWESIGFEWLKENWDERHKVFPRYWNDPRFGANRKNAPVVGLSWYEANAYCKWLLSNWDDLEEGKQGLLKPEIIRLPTEQEWSLAAGGEKDGRYAWGAQKDGLETIHLASTRESDINRTTPVWMYPLGKSQPYELMDMSGNVWEWQANYRDQKRGWIALRGGSWSGNSGLASISYRNDAHPNGQWYSRGFRLLAIASQPD